MLMIRLKKIGKKNAPAYRLVLTEKTAAVQAGSFLEILGSYSPRHKKVSLDGERIKYWISKGAQTSDTVYNLLVKEGVVEGAKRKKKITTKKKTAVSEQKAETPAPAAPEPAAEAPRA